MQSHWKGLRPSLSSLRAHQARWRTPAPAYLRGNKWAATVHRLTIASTDADSPFPIQRRSACVWCTEMELSRSPFDPISRLPLLRPLTSSFASFHQPSQLLQRSRCNVRALVPFSHERIYTVGQRSLPDKKRSTNLRTLRRSIRPLRERNFNLLRWKDVPRTSRIFCHKIAIFPQF